MDLRHSHRLPVYIATFMTLPAAGMLTPASAFGAQNPIEEIVITARRANERLSDVPISITAFSASDIQDAGIQRPEDFIALTPNVVMANTANVGDTLVTIRGITSTRDAESNFALVVDGVLITNPNGFNRELLDVAQIEVLKGPQGALYGRNAASGAILITTNTPDQNFDAELTGGLGNNNAYRVNGALSGALSDNLVGRLSFSRRSSDGHFRNVFLDKKNVDFFENDTIRGRLLYDAGPTSWDLRAGYSQSDSGTINFNAAFALPPFTSFGTPGDELFFADVNQQEFQYAFNVPPSNKQETFDLALKMDHELTSGLTLTAILAFNDLDESLLSDGTSAAFGGYAGTAACAASVTPETIALVNAAPPQFLFAGPGQTPTPDNSLLSAYTPLTCDGYQYQERNQSDLSLEVRLASADNASRRWVVGGYVADIERDVIVGYGADLGQGFLRQAFVPADGPNPTDLLFSDTFDTRVYSVFGQFALDLGEDFELSLEGRFDREERDVSNNVPTEASALLFGGGAPLNPARSTIDEVIPDRSKTFNQFQPKVSLRWDLSERTSAYGSYGVGFRSGGFNSLGSQALTEFWFNSGDPFGLGAVGANIDVQDEYSKEVTQAFEVGVKGNYLDNRLKLNAALFHTVVDDNQFFEFFAGPFGLLRAVTTIDELRLQGAEVDFDYRLTDSLKVFGGVGYTDGKIRKNNHRPDTEGNDAPLAPDYTLNLGGQWTRQLMADIELLVRIDYARIGKTWFHTVQDNQQPAIWTALLGFPVASDMSRTRRNAFDTVDLRAALNATNWTLTAWGRNITNKSYLSEVIAAPEFGGSFNHQAPEASYGLDLSYRF